MGKAYCMAAEWAETDSNDTHWQIDTSANDIYGEIDRALSSAHSITSTFQKGASSILTDILAELKRRGCVQAGEEFSLDDQEPADSAAAMRASMFQDIYEDIWNTLRRGDKEEE